MIQSANRQAKIPTELTSKKTVTLTHQPSTWQIGLLVCTILTNNIKIIYVVYYKNIYGPLKRFYDNNKNKIEDSKVTYSMAAESQNTV